MYEMLSGATDIIFYVVAAIVIVTAVVKMKSKKKDEKKRAELTSRNLPANVHYHCNQGGFIMPPKLFLALQWLPEITAFP